MVFTGEVVSRAHWAGGAQRQLLDHAEMLALMEAERSGKVSNRSERQAATLYTTLEPCALCMAAAMSFLLGTVVYGAEAPVDGGSNLPAVWAPPNGHPASGVPYAIPRVIAGMNAEASIDLMAEWVRRDPRRAWAAGYLPPARSS